MIIAQGSQDEYSQVEVHMKSSCPPCEAAFGAHLYSELASRLAEKG